MTCPVCKDPEEECWGREIERGPVYSVGPGHYGPDFCPRFEALVRDQIENAITLKELRVAIADYYEIHPTGGDCHIVLDDYNYEHHNVQFCIDNADTPEGRVLAEKLLALSLEERAYVNDWQFCRCGHAMSLHHWWDPDGSWGMSRAGKCGSKTCSCTNAECVEEHQV